MTGGSRGIGRAVVDSLLASGARVAFCGRQAETVARAVNELSGKYQHEVFGATADVRESVEVSSFLNEAERRFGGPEILVNNAGLGVFSAAGDLKGEDWARVIGTNLTGVYHCCRETIPRMKARGGGFIINISSLAGVNAFTGGAVYNASKFGLNGFTEAMMLDHRHDNIRVSLIAPGSVDTEFSPRTGMSAGSEWKIAPEDIAETVLAILRLPSRTLLSYVEMRPSRPPR